VFRLGIGVLVLGQAIAVCPHIDEIHGELGIVQTAVAAEFVLPLMPRVGWVSWALAPLLGSGIGLYVVFGTHLCAALAFLAGWRTRPAAIVLWLTNLMLAAGAAPHLYGLDTFTRIALFYAMFAPVGAALSCDSLRAGPAPPSFAARLSLRVLQVHLCIAYGASGIEKATGIQWWNGEALWRSWMRPDLAAVDFSAVAWTPWLAAIGCWATLLLEVGYAVFLWPRRTRRAWAAGIVALHLSIAVTMSLWAFSLVMIVLTVSAWVVPSEPAGAASGRALGITRIRGTPAPRPG
jgi:hypothetical protein